MLCNADLSVSFNADIVSRDGYTLVIWWGEPLSDICRDLETSPAALLELNGLSVNELKYGQALRVAMNGSTDRLRRYQKLDREVSCCVRGYKRVALTFDVNSEESAENLLTCLDAVDAKVTVYWRPPYASRNSRIFHAAAVIGFRSVFWTVDVLDSVGDEKSTSFIAQRVISLSDHDLDGTIALLHAARPSSTAAVPYIVDDLTRRGFSLVTMKDAMVP